MRQTGRVPLHCKPYGSERPYLSWQQYFDGITDFRFGLPTYVAGDLYSVSQFIGLWKDTAELRTTICARFGFGFGFGLPGFEAREADIPQM